VNYQGYRSLVALSIFFVIPLLFSNNTMIVNACVMIAIFALMSYGVDLVLSYVGEVSLGHLIFLAVGAYTAGFGATVLGLGPLQTLALALVLCMVAGVGVGVITLRSREFVFSVITYAAALVAQEIVYNSDALGASEGITGLPVLKLSIGSYSYAADSNLNIWPVAFVLLAIGIFIVDRFRRSQLGRQALMAQLNPALAENLGVNLNRVRFLVLVLSAPIVGAAGWLYAYQRGYVGPDVFQPYFLILSLTAVLLWGTRKLLGPLLGVALIIFQESFLSVGGDGNKVILGAILVAVLLRPQGRNFNFGLNWFSKRSASTNLLGATPK
jgi:branched-chain amino acid transport system permease protein